MTEARKIWKSLRDVEGKRCMHGRNVAVKICEI